MTGQMWPINGGSKAKRIKWGSPQNQISWAFMKQLREKDKTKMIYDCNPYIEVYQFRDNLYGLFNQNCDGAGDVWMYLIVGPEKAMLIDTAFGLGDIKALADQISGGKPLIVVNTHSHFDHAYGNCRFDRVYCHEYEEPLVKSQNEHIWDYLFDQDGNNIWLEFDRKDLPIWREYEIVGVPDGYTFNLGGDYEVELVWLGGHAPGMAAYLDKKNRIVFPGDDLCSDVSGVAGGPRPGGINGQYQNLTVFRDNLSRLVARIDEFDYVFPSHFMVNLENSVLIEELATCNAVLDNPDDYDYVYTGISPNGGQQVERRFKYIKGFSALAYTTKGLFPPVSTEY
jgi:glyoxylase-like metal-dependent hydrolase (beta-lactamase superfamily II)